MLTGSASRIGDQLLVHKKIKQINFTGSVPVGRHVMRQAAENLVPATLELGGNDAGLMPARRKFRWGSDPTNIFGFVHVNWSDMYGAQANLCTPVSL